MKFFLNSLCLLDFPADAKCSFNRIIMRQSAVFRAIDLPEHQDKPDARQIFHSSLQYIDSPAFDPRGELDSTLLDKRLP